MSASLPSFISTTHGKPRQSAPVPGSNPATRLAIAAFGCRCRSARLRADRRGSARNPFDAGGGTRRIRRAPYPSVAIGSRDDPAGIGSSAARGEHPSTSSGNRWPFVSASVPPTEAHVHHAGASLSTLNGSPAERTRGSLDVARNDEPRTTKGPRANPVTGGHKEHEGAHVPSFRSLEPSQATARRMSISAPSMSAAAR